MRIAIGQLSQETNTFNPIATTRLDFEDFGILRGPELIERMADTNELGGFIQSLRRWPEHPEIVGLVRLAAWPSGMATRETFAWLRDDMLDALQQALPVDGVLVSLHGAMVSEDMPDVEGEMLRALRQRLGPNVPLVATLDLHANITQMMVEAADALVLFHTAPHIDIFETGERGAAVLRRMLVDRAKPAKAFQKLPLVVPAERANTEDATSVSYAFELDLQGLEAQRSILTAGLATVQPWLDIPKLGASVLVIADGDVELAQRQCQRLAGELWRRRRDYLPELVAIEEAVRQAWETDGLVVLSDSADATTSGAPGDSTWLLRELIQYDWPRPALVTLVAPDVVAEARRRGVGAELTGPLGGLRDWQFSQPLTLAVQVANLFDARFILSGHLGRNLPIDMGLSAVLRIGNVHIVATTRSGPHFAPQLFQAAGLDAFTAKVLVAKSPCGFRAAYAGRASKIVVVRAPGCAPSDFWRYEYKRIPRPMWPWDDMDDQPDAQDSCLSH